MKTVTWVGGPHDGEQFSMPDRGASLDVILDSGPPQVVEPTPDLDSNAPEPPPERKPLRVARVPIASTPLGWRAQWNKRVERDW